MADEEDELEDDELPSEPAPTAWPGAEPKQAAFLTALVFHGGQHGKAAKSARISRTLHYHWLKTHTNYQVLHAGAMEQVTEILEDEALKRAQEGASDAMLMFLLKAANREKYGERTEVKGKVDVTHKFEGTMEELLATYRKLTREGPEE